MRHVWISIILILLLTGCAQTQNTTNNTQVANPWQESSVSEVESELGTDVILPEGADVKYCQLLEEERLAEIVFTLDGLSYTYRIKPTDEPEDISGLYYDWMAEDDVTIGHFEGVCKRAKDAEETVDYVGWFDEVNGLQYSLSAMAEDLDGFDITAIAAGMIAAD